MPIISKRSKIKVYHKPYCPYAKRMDKKYRRNVIMDYALSKGYRACSCCYGIHGTYLELKIFPMAYPEELKNMKLSYDFKWKTICFRTKNEFWKVGWNDYENGYKLFHLNSDCYDERLTDQELMKGKFHRQKDVKSTSRLGNLIIYMDRHNKAKEIMEDDWRKLPKNTKEQKHYYKQAKKRERKRSIRRVNEIFEELERSKQTNGRSY